MLENAARRSARAGRREERLWVLRSSVCCAFVYVPLFVGLMLHYF